MEQKKRIHPNKFTMWVAIASLTMMFAGLTSAYVVKRSQPGWTSFELPLVFWYSTAVILISSFTIQSAVKAFRDRERLKYRRFLLITAVLGCVFLVLQLIGFSQIWASGIHFSGAGGGQFLYIIAGLHGLHVLGGLIALLFLIFRALSTRVRNYNPVPVEVMSVYWHFVDILWIYLMVFFIVLQ